MSAKVAGVLLAPLLLAGCAGFTENSSRQGTHRDVTSAPADGLWSHRFVGWPDGRITAVGFSRAPAGIAIAHFTRDGEADESLTVHPEFGAGKLDALAVARAGTDGLFIAGCQPPDCWGYFVLGRFRRDGSRDSTFGNDGLVRTSFPGGALEPRAIAVQRDGKIVVGGELSIDSSRQGFLARYLPDGRVDPLFGDGGLMPTELGGITAVTTHPDGRIVAAGRRVDLGTRPASMSVEVVRYLANGQVDDRFGVGGVASVKELWDGRTVLIDGRERILVAGRGRRGRGTFVGIVRLTASGARDPTFADGGHVLHRRPGDHAASIETLTPLPRGRLVATGWVVRGKSVLARRYRLLVLLLRSSGTLVRSFGQGGRMTLAEVEAKGQAVFRTERGLIAVGADDDLEPKRIVFAAIRLPR